MLGPREVRITLDGGRTQTFYPGARISGEVTYKTLGNDRLQSVSIDLRGTEKVLAGKNLPFKTPEFIEVFHIHEVLQKTPLWTHGKLLKWPFDMTLPLLTGPNRSDAEVYYTSDPDNELFDTAPHPLAPTIKQEHSQGMRVEYEMYAIAMYGSKSQGASRFLAEASVCDVIDSLNYLPDSYIAQDNPSPLVEVSFALGNGRIKTSILGAIRRGSRTSLSSGNSKGKLVATLPGRIVVGEPVNISFQFVPNATEDMPSYMLKQVNAVVRATTHRRTKDVVFDVAFAEVKDRKLGSNSILRTLNQSKQSCSFPTTELRSCPSSFKSYSIAVSHQLLIQATIVNGPGHDRYEEQAEYITMVTLVRHIDATESNRRRLMDLPPPSLSPRPHSPEEDELPGYEEHGNNVLISQ